MLGDNEQVVSAHLTDFGSVQFVAPGVQAAPAIWWVPHTKIARLTNITLPKPFLFRVSLAQGWSACLELAA
jgi:hypothetical protein